MNYLDQHNFFVYETEALNKINRKEDVELYHLDKWQFDENGVRLTYPVKTATDY